MRLRLMPPRSLDKGRDFLVKIAREKNMHSEFVIATSYIQHLGFNVFTTAVDLLVDIIVFVAIE